ncbi:hypothetical protein QBC34DRAFT_419429 [Podospora aff. communis PSN243]|uniref:Uncharacterized protein n=1 Tax=Podospora aff. communis PSN243 TaxID=3040156 RepID=A0AAV9FV37_9PEZI|nr:hypothetical protein QBC34DRAFT_419429 [Podospora aff. communis PSN243]
MEGARRTPCSRQDMLTEALCAHPELRCPINCGSGVTVHTLAHNFLRDKIATVRFCHLPSLLRDLEIRRGSHLTLTLPPSAGVEGLGEFKGATITIDSHFDGTTILYSPHPQRHHLDILAVSGLGGHPYGSFTHKQDGHMWLADSLPQDLPTARVMIYGSNNRIPNSTSFAELDDLAGSFYLALVQILRSKPGNSLVVMGHSLGGLLIKEALVRLLESENDAILLSQIAGCVFFGVPNDGMAIESLIPMVGDQVNRSLLESIRHVNSQILRIQKRAFSRVLAASRISVFCLFETELSPTAIRVGEEYKMEGPLDYLVTQPSATSCLPPNSPPDHSIAIPRTHSELVKFALHDNEYDKVIYVLSQIRDKPDGTKNSNSTETNKPGKIELEFQPAKPALVAANSDDKLPKSVKRKLVIVGDGGIGKTCLLVVFSKGSFPEVYVPTVFENYVADIEIDGKRLELGLWDTAGQEYYDRLRPLSYPDASVILIGFSIDSPNSLDNVFEKWISEVKHFCKGVPILLVGTKKDLRYDQGVIEELRKISQKPVSLEEGTAASQKIGAFMYLECSAKTSEGVRDVFKVASRLALYHRGSKWKRHKCIVL